MDDRSHNPSQTSPRPHNPAVPIDLRLKLSAQRLEIDWADGHTSRFDLGYLRANCPCAACRTEREKRSREQAKGALPILSSRPIDDLRVVDAELCGNYAIRLRWSDGHETGIYDYAYLRSLDHMTSATG